MANLQLSLVKVVLLGDSGVGKTSLMNRYVKEKFDRSFKPTIGADFLRKQVIVDDQAVNLQIWDTAGQERFQSLGGAFYRGAEACVLVYDVTDQSSFQHLSNWQEEFLTQACPTEPESFPFVLVGNKCDMARKRQVSADKAKAFARQDGVSMLAIETSAKEDLNVEQVFVEIAKMALKRQPTVGSIDIPDVVDFSEPAGASARDDSTCCG